MLSVAKRGEMTAKRYQFGKPSYGAKPSDLINGMTQYVLASDYDALAAELSDYKGRASSSATVIAALDANLDASVARIAALEAALREAIDYVTLDSEYPLEMVNRWERAFTPETPAKSRPSFYGWIQGPCENCGKLSTEHPQPMMECPTSKTKVVRYPERQYA
jgi:hypothetical protein